MDASNTPAKEYARVFCQALIELAYILSQEKPDDESWWIDAIARVKFNGDPAVVDAGFDTILSYEKQEDPGGWTFQDHDTYQQRYYQNFIRLEEYSPLNTHPDYPAGLEQFQEQVDARWGELRGLEQESG